MAHLEFVIPQTTDELLREDAEAYTVKEPVVIREIPSKLREAKLYIKEQGPEFILENFDTYFSVFYHADNLPLDLLYDAYVDLHKVVAVLSKRLEFILTERESIDDELRLKYTNIMKMMLYVYIKIVTAMEAKVESRRAQNLPLKVKGKKKTPEIDAQFVVDRKAVLVNVNNIIQQEIGVFWEPPIVDDVFINLLADIPYKFLENPAICKDKEARVELFHLLGTMIKYYSHGVAFVVRIVQLIKTNEHICTFIHEGIELLVTNYNCKSLVRDFVREITEWQTEEENQDNQASRYCSTVLTELAILMPKLMIPEVVYLQKYLNHESSSLRIAVLSVIAEIILKVLSKSNLSAEEIESRDELLDVMMEHIVDISGFVRAKIYHHWARLEKDNAIPMKFHLQILELIAVQLEDKAVLARKAAAQCITTFVVHNKYGAELDIRTFELQLEKAQKELEAAKIMLGDENTIKTMAIRNEFLEHAEAVKELIAQKYCGENLAFSDEEIPPDILPELIRTHIRNKDYDAAVKLCGNTAFNADTPCAQISDFISKENRAAMFLMLIRTIFCTIETDKENCQPLPTTVVDNNDNNSVNVNVDNDQPSTVNGGAALPNVNGEYERALVAASKLEVTVDYLTGACDFIRIIQGVIPTMCMLLETTSPSDMHEAMEFFTAAANFKIRGAEKGCVVMLRSLRHREQSRRDYVINAFKKIYLVTDIDDATAHCEAIVERLINLRKSIQYDNYVDLKQLIAEWVIKGIIDNNIIDVLFKYFIKRKPVSDSNSRAALNLIAMAASGKNTVISRNIQIITSTVFLPPRNEDLLLVMDACDALCYVNGEKQTDDKKTPFRIKLNDDMWKHLIQIVANSFEKKCDYYNTVLTSVVKLIYQLCSKPDKVIEAILHLVLAKMKKCREEHNDQIASYLLIRCNHLLGEVAIAQLNYLDETVYKETKRRQFIIEERNNNNNDRGEKTKKKLSSAGRNKQRKELKNASAVTNSSSASNNTSTSVENPDESVMCGGQAEDTDAEFILGVLEYKTVTGNSCALGSLAHLIVTVCEHPEVYGNMHLQSTSVIALLKYMLVSSVFCQKYIQLIFTILEKTPHSSIKCNILIQLSDLLERFPNVVEPWSDKMYLRLKDPEFEVRRTAFYILASLVLRDMIRIKSDTSKMACCIVDPHDQMKEMAKTFFQELAKKLHNLHNLLPDIFSHLCADLDNNGDIRTIMKYLFALIDKSKTMETLVDRFCAKYVANDDTNFWSNVTYCLTLIQYSDKALRKLTENFLMYKHALLAHEVYVFFKQILSTCGKSVKPEIKAIVGRLEAKIAQVFTTAGDDVTTGNDTSQMDTSAVGVGGAVTGRSIFKKPRGAARASKASSRRKKVRRATTGSSDDEEEEEDDDGNGDEEWEGDQSAAGGALANTRRNRENRAKKAVVIDSDSE